MKILPTTFRSDDFDFEQLAREGMVVLFRKSKPQFSNISYEVMVLHESKDHIGPRGNLILAAECMPQNEKWGEQAWSCREKADAEVKFRKCVSRHSALCDYPEPSNGFHSAKVDEFIPLSGQPILPTSMITKESIEEPNSSSDSTELYLPLAIPQENP